MAEPDQEAEIEVNLQAVCDGTTRELKTLADLRLFLKEYSDFYEFIRDGKPPTNQHPLSEVRGWADLILRLSSNRSDWYSTNDHRNPIRRDLGKVLNADAQACLPHHTSLRAQKIKSIWEDHGEQAGAAAAIMATTSPSLDTIWSNRNAIKGALAYVLSDTRLESTGTRSAEAGIADALSRFEGSRDGLLAETDSLRRDVNDQIESHDQALDQMQASFATAIKRISGDYDARVAQAITQLENTKKTYIEFMKLAAPRKYWNDKAVRHAKDAAVLMIASLAWLLVAGGFLGVGLWQYILPVDSADCNVTTLEVLRQWMLPNTSNLECPTQDVSLSSYAPRAALGLILSTVFFWIARLLVRLWLSETHLNMDAGERVVMIDSYLALKHEGHVTDEDRALILTPLFRPTQDGIVKDDAAADPYLMGILSNFRRS